MQRTPLFFPAFLLFLSALLCSGCVFHTAGPSESSITTSYDDATVRYNLSSILANRDPVASAAVEVFCFNRHVFIVGYADKGFQTLAETSARAEKGVKQVTSHWFSEPALDRMANARLAANIESKLLLDTSISAVRMAVAVNNGEVVLAGTVPDRKNAEQVISLARQVERVKSVTSYLSY